MFKRIFINLTIFSLIIGSFSYLYFIFGKNAKAENDYDILAYCVKNDYTDYITIYKEEDCMPGYFKADSSFDLNLIKDPNDPLWDNPDEPGGDPDEPGNTDDPNGNGNGNGNGNNTVPVGPPIYTESELATGRFLYLDPSEYRFCVLLTRNMMLGMSDNDTKGEVSALQEYLYDRGYSNMPATGVFNEDTEFGVKRFEYRNQIYVDGVVRPEFRALLQEITCVKYPVITYEKKPISPILTVPTPPKPVVIKTTPVKPVIKPVIITPTKIEEDKEEDTPVIITPTTKEEEENTLQPVSGNLYLIKRNNLYFTYNSKSAKPFICITLNNADCSIDSNYAPINEGILNNFFEAIKYKNYWSFYLYNSQIWGNAGDKVKIYLKESFDSKNKSIFLINVYN